MNPLQNGGKDELNIVANIKTRYQKRKDIYLDNVNNTLYLTTK